MQALITIMIVLANFTANIGEINNTQWHEIYTTAHEVTNIRVYEDGSYGEYDNNRMWISTDCLSVGACQD